MRPLLTTPGGVTLLGAGAASGADLRTALALAPRLVAADAGADLALAEGLVPELVIGDLDSISPAARDRLADRLHHVAEQDSTDFEKCLQRIDAGFVLAAGFSGSRLDHTLAALSVVVRRTTDTILMLTETEVTFRAPPRLELDLAPGQVVSLFPMGAVEGRSTGLVWPIDGLRLAPDRRVGTSNAATGPVLIESTGPLLVMLPKVELATALRALIVAPPGKGLGEAP